MRREGDQRSGFIQATSVAAARTYSVVLSYGWHATEKPLRSVSRTLHIPTSLVFLLSQSLFLDPSPTNRFILPKIDFLPPSKFLDRNHYYSFLSSFPLFLSPSLSAPFLAVTALRDGERGKYLQRETSVWGSNKQRSCYEDIAAQRFRVQTL